jgi:hypothetical protein
MKWLIYQRVISLETEVQVREKNGLTRTPGHTGGGIRCLGGVSIPTNTDPRIYRRWDQVPRRSKYPNKHGPPDIPEVGSGA